MKHHRSLVSHNTRFYYCFPLLYLAIFHKANRTWACCLKTSLLQKIEELRANRQVKLMLKFSFCRGKLLLHSHQPCISGVKMSLDNPHPTPGGAWLWLQRSLISPQFYRLLHYFIRYYIPTSSVKNKQTVYGFIVPQICCSKRCGTSLAVYCLVYLYTICRRHYGGITFLSY